MQDRNMAIYAASSESLRATLHALKTPGTVRDESFIVAIEKELRLRQRSAGGRDAGPKPMRRRPAVKARRR